MTRMLGFSNPKWRGWYRWSAPAELRRNARAAEAEALRRGDEMLRPTYPDTDGREYWDSLNADDSNAPTAEVWRAQVENEAGIYSLPIGYRGTWRVG